MKFMLWTLKRKNEMRTHIDIYDVGLFDSSLLLGFPFREEGEKDDERMGEEDTENKNITISYIFHDLRVSR